MKIASPREPGQHKYMPWRSIEKKKKKKKRRKNPTRCLFLLQTSNRGETHRIWVATKTSGQRTLYRSNTAHRCGGRHHVPLVSRKMARICLWPFVFIVILKRMVFFWCNACLTRTTSLLPSLAGEQRVSALKLVLDLTKQDSLSIYETRRLTWAF